MVVRYLVSELDRALRFYTAALGFSIETQMGDAFAIVKRHDLELWLSGPHTSAARPMPNGDQPCPGGWNRFVLTVDDIEEMARTLAAANVKIRSEIVTGPGGEQLLIEDPEGNPIELFQPF